VRAAPTSGHARALILAHALLLLFLDVPSAVAIVLLWATRYRWRCNPRLGVAGVVGRSSPTQPSLPLSQPVTGEAAGGTGAEASETGAPEHESASCVRLLRVALASKAQWHVRALTELCALLLLDASCVLIALVLCVSPYHAPLLLHHATTFFQRAVAPPDARTGLAHEAKLSHLRAFVLGRACLAPFELPVAAVAVLALAIAPWRAPELWRVLAGPLLSELQLQAVRTALDPAAVDRAAARVTSYRPAQGR